MGISPWGRTDLHFAMTHSLGLKTPREQWRCLAWYRAVHIQALGRIWTEELTQHHPHLRGHSSCGGAAVTMATLLYAETHPLCPYMPLSWPAQVRHAHLCVCAHLCLHIGGWVSAPNGSKLCWQLQPAAKLCFCKLFIPKSQKHNDQTTVSEQS